jgi:hypothetical protein
MQEYNGKGIVKLIKHIHFNPDVPENHNIRTHKNDMVQVYEDGDWTIKSSTSTFSDLVANYKTEFGSKMSDPDFETYIECHISLKLLKENFAKFGHDESPAHYYRCIRDLKAIVADFESKAIQRTMMSPCCVKQAPL